MTLQVKWTDDFVGPDVGYRWVAGHLNGSAEVRLQVHDGLRFVFAEGRQYASAGVVTREELKGDFEAEVRFEVANPAPGTTFELAALTVAPPPDSGLPPETFTEAHRFFNVHGAPPYVSSEFDEDDGWRIGWNTGHLQGGWVDGQWVADNRDNRYGKSIDRPAGRPAAGWLRLARTGGSLWTTAGRPDVNAPWKESGRLDNGFLSGPVRLRLVAKHWVKRREDLEIAPANAIVLGSFTLSG